MNNITAIIVSFLRPAYLKKCVLSLRKQYPDIKIIVGENGEKTKDMSDFLKKNNAKYIQLPFDSGVCYARNTLIKKVDTKYVLVGDDDFLYEKEARVDKMLKLLENSKFDLVGGRVRDKKGLQNYQGTIDIYPTYFHYHKLELDNFKKIKGVKYKECDITFNFFLAKLSSIKDVPWDNKIKVAYEHSSWFIDLKKKKKKVVFTPDCIVYHKPKIEEVYPDYSQYRRRQNDRDRFFERFDIDYTIDMDGRISYKKEPEQKKDSIDITKVDFVIKTFERYNCLENLLKSIRQFYPNNNLIIVDDSINYKPSFYNKWKNKLKIDLIRTVPDIGISAGRNIAVKRSSKPYILLLDDDFIFTNDTKIEKFISILKSDIDIGIVGGMCIEKNKEVHYENFLKIKNGSLIQEKDGNKWHLVNGVKTKQTGCVLNFFLARRQALNDIKWDNELKLAEHTDYFIRFNRSKWKIYYTPEVKINHDRYRDNDYLTYRDRSSDYSIKMFNKHKITKIIKVNGAVSELKGDEFHKYRIN